MRKRMILLITSLVFLLLLSGCGSGFFRGISGTRVAILDSGIQSERGITVDEGWNYLDNSSSIEDDKGHGTQMAQLVCRYAPNAVIVPLKISGSTGDTTPEIVIRAIYDAVDKYDCRVMCMSFSIPDSEELQEAVNYASEKNVILISAAGNLGETYKKTKLLYPASYDTVIGVGAVDENGEVADYSQRNQSVCVTALGSSPDGKQQGTSYAAARVTGICAKKQWDSREEFLEYLANHEKDLLK